MKINFKKIWSVASFPFRLLGRLLIAVWKWARKRIIKMPASEAEAFLLSLALILCCVWIGTIGTLIEYRYIVEEKVKIIQQQAQVIETYKIKERTIKVPGKVKIVTVDVKQLQRQMMQTQQEAAQLRREKSYYQQLARKYSHPAPTARTPAQRVQTEEQINDQFITDWGTKK